MKLRCSLFCSILAYSLYTTSASALPVSQHTSITQHNRRSALTTERLNKQSLEKAQRGSEAVPLPALTLKNIPLNTTNSVIAAGTGTTVPIIKATPQAYSSSQK